MRLLFFLTAVAGPVMSLSGKATTTRYFDGSAGACGCGTQAIGPFPWQLGGDGFYTAAGSAALFGNKTWCGSGCGTCYKLTSTGSSPPGQGTGGPVGQTIIVMITNLCPPGPTGVYCPAIGKTNHYGYDYHFDIMANHAVLGSNVIVDFESVPCPDKGVADYKTCAACQP